MTTKIKCPVCKAKTELNPKKLRCRRCEEDLSLLYFAKGHSFKFRLQLAQSIHHPDSQIKQQIASAAIHFAAPKR